jgi:hypothetical protein
MEQLARLSVSVKMITAVSSLKRLCCPVFSILMNLNVRKNEIEYAYLVLYGLCFVWSEIQCFLNIHTFLCFQAG